MTFSALPRNLDHLSIGHLFSNCRAALPLRFFGSAICLLLLAGIALPIDPQRSLLVEQTDNTGSFGPFPRLSSNESLLIRVRIDVEDRDVVRVIETAIAESMFAAKTISKDDAWDIRFRTGADRGTIVVERDGEAPVSTQTKQSLTAELVGQIIFQEYRWQALNSLENRDSNSEVGVELRIVRIRSVEVVRNEPLLCRYQMADDSDSGTTGGHLNENDKFIFHFRNTGKSAAHIYILTLDGNGTAKLLFQTGNQKVPPDGKWFSTASETFGPNCSYYYIPTGSSGADIYKAFATSRPVDWSGLLVDVPSGRQRNFPELHTGAFLSDQGGSWSSASIRFLTGRDAPVTYDISIDALSGEEASGRSAASPNFEKSSINKLERYSFTGDNANFEQIHSAFERIIARSSPNDTFLFRFSGNIRFPAGDLSKSGPEKVVFELKNAGKREITLELLNVWLSRLRARSRLLILDSEMEPPWFSSIGRQILGSYDRRRTPNRSTIVWGSVVNSGKPFRNRLLSEMFDRSISSDADSNRDGSLTVFELLNITQQTIFRESDQKRRVSSVEEGPDFLLASVPMSGEAGRSGAPLSSVKPTGQRADLFVEARSDASPLRVLGKNYALIFATNRYDNYTGLKNPLNDAQDLGNTLRQEYGFEVEIKADLSREEIWNTIFEYQSKEFAPNDQLLIFFAGHGKYLPAPYNQGYLIARDSPKTGPPGSIYLGFSRLVDEIEMIRNEHILLILDVCNGGALRYSAIRSADSDEEYGEVSAEKHIDRTLRYKTRKFLTSGGNEYVSDGKGRNSPFAYRLLKFLREPNEARRDGLITFLELASDLTKIPNQTPQAGDLYGNVPGSDFLFPVRRN